MKKVLLFTVIILSLTASSQENWSFQRDKQLHAIVGAGLGVGLTQLMISSDLGYDPIDVIIAPVLPITFIALGKEMYDQAIKGGYAEGADIAYTMIGGLIGSFVTYSINDRINNRKEKDKLKL